MKKSILAVCIFTLLVSTNIFSQISINIVGEEVFVKKQYVFNIVSMGYGTEVVVINKSGVVLLCFIPFKIQNGWHSITSNTYSGYRSTSGTSYTNFYRVADTSGDYCDIPIGKLLNVRNMAKYVIAFALVTLIKYRSDLN